MIIDKRPEQLKMDFHLWSRAAVGQLIEQEFGIKLQVRSIGKCLIRSRSDWRIRFRPGKSCASCMAHCKYSSSLLVMNAFPCAANLKALQAIKLGKDQALEFILAVPGRRYHEFADLLGPFQRQCTQGLRRSEHCSHSSAFRITGYHSMAHSR
jgi:hypothetical protein